MTEPDIDGEFPVLFTRVSQVEVFGFCSSQGDVAVPTLVADPADLSQHPHRLLARLWLHRVSCQIGVASVASLKLLLLPSSQLMVHQNRVKGVVLIQEREEVNILSAV